MDKSESSELAAAAKRPSARRVATESDHPPAEATGTIPKRVHARRPSEDGGEGFEGAAASLAEAEADEAGELGEAGKAGAAAELDGSQGEPDSAPRGQPPVDSAVSSVRSASFSDAGEPSAQPRAQTSPAARASRASTPGQGVEVPARPPARPRARRSRVAKPKPQAGEAVPAGHADVASAAKHASGAERATRPRDPERLEGSLVEPRTGPGLEHGATAEPPAGPAHERVATAEAPAEPAATHAPAMAIHAPATHAPATHAPPSATHLPEPASLSTSSFVASGAAAIADAAELTSSEALPPPSLDHADFADDFGLDAQYEAKLRPWLESLCERHFHLELEGAENIPAHGRALLVANHSRATVWDGIVLRTALRQHHPAGREARWLVDDQQFHAPFLGTFVNRLGGVRACQENAERLLLREQLVAVFPEGAKAAARPYEDRYRLQRFGRGGYVKLALRTGAPVIPVAIVAMEYEGAVWRNRLASASRLLGAPLTAFRPGFPFQGAGRFGVPPLSCRMRVFVGAPIPEISRQDASATRDDGLVHELNECVRGAVQSLVNASLHV